jgi:peptide/nickel transport system substrate-binding protein
VIFSLARAAAAPGAPPGFGLNFRGRSAVRVDDVTVRVATAEPYPLLPNDMTAIPIVSKNRVAGAAAADFASGKAAIGTGPYKFAARAPGDRIQLVANPDYWGAKPAWSTVTFRANKAGPARVAALLAGETDVIEDVPSADIARLKSEAKVALAQSTSYRVVFLQMDQWRDTTPFANAKDGSAIKNPFKNPKVRRAIATVINREAICARVMDGNATVAGQFLPDGFFGVSPNVKPIQYDPEKAKRLLTEAGFPNGFKVTLHGPAGRYPNDTKIIEAVAQMLSRIGIEATIETMPPTQFFTRATSGADGEPEFSLFLAGWAASSGENSSPLKGLVATHNKETSFGLSNRGRYSNKAVDDALDTALRTLDNALLNAGLARATELALADTALIPILHPLNTWGVRRGLAYRARADEATTAMMVREEQAP